MFLGYLEHLLVSLRFLPIILTRPQYNFAMPSLPIAQSGFGCEATLKLDVDLVSNLLPLHRLLPVSKRGPRALASVPFFHPQDESTANKECYNQNGSGDH